MFLWIVSALLLVPLLLVPPARPQGVVGTSLFPSRKTWWAKRVSPWLYTAGRLTHTQLAQAADSGFSTVISHYTLMDNVTLGSDDMTLGVEEMTLGPEVMYDTVTARHFAEEVAGLHFEVILEGDETSEWGGLETVQRLAEVIQRSPKPILYHCVHSNVSTLMALTYMLNQTQNDPNFEPHVDIKEVFRRASVMGFTFNVPRVRQLVSNITGSVVDDNQPSPDVSDPSWYEDNRWIVKPLHKNIYISGQVRLNYFPGFKNSLFESWINLRRGVTTPPRATPSQEEVTLINIPDRTGTYNNGGRQRQSRLLQIRIDPSRLNQYVGLDSGRNYQSMNPLEFGDDIGYNESLARQAVEGHLNLTYYHTPIGGEFGYSPATWDQYRDTWVQASQGTAVLFQCRTGYRSTVAALLTAGHLHGKDSTWALSRATDMGYAFQEGSATAVINFIMGVLGQNTVTSPTSDTVTSQSTRYDVSTAVTVGSKASTRTLSHVLIMIVLTLYAF